MDITVRLATLSDTDMLLAADVFDAPPKASFLDEFLSDSRHHLVISMDGDHCVGFLSAVHYIHPDKPCRMWINELGVNETHQRRGLATRLIKHILKHAKTLGCNEAWVLADPTDEALEFYASLNAHREGEHIAMFTFDLETDADG